MSHEKPALSPQKLLQAKVAQIEGMDVGQLKQWLQTRLRGKDALLADMAGNSRAYPVIAIYPKLKRTVREDVQAACIEMLNEFVSGGGLHGEAADDLLILSQGLAPDKAGARLRYLAEATEHFNKLPVELRKRVVQTLVALGEQMDTPFWKSRFQKDGRSITAICFEGITMNSVKDSLDFLMRIGSDADVLDSVALHIPAFLERVLKCGQEKAFASAFYSSRNRLPSKLREEICEWCGELGIPQRPESRSTWLGENFDPQSLFPDFNGNGRSHRLCSLRSVAAL